MKDNTYIKNEALLGFREYVEKLGGDPVHLLKQAGIPPEILNQKIKYCSFVNYSNLLELTAEKLGEPTFGSDLAWSLPHHMPNLGPLMILGYFCKSPKEWFNTAMRYLPTHTNAVNLALLEDREANTFKVEISITPRTANHRQIIENAFVIGQRLMGEHIGGRYCNPLAMRYRLSKPSKKETLQTHIDCPIEFNCNQNEIVFDLRLLNEPMGSHFIALRPIVDKVMDFRLGRSTMRKLTAAEQVETTIEIILGTGRCNLEHVAKSMGVHPKKLQRQLASRGENFSGILERVRENLARYLLSKTDIPIVKIAKILDYSETPPFTLAFKRWSGVSPKNYRDTVTKSGASK